VPGDPGDEDASGSRADDRAGAKDTENHAGSLFPGSLFLWARRMDRLDPEARSRLMRAVRTKDTTPELRVRGLVHRLGYRFRLHRRDLAGTPDLVLPRLRLAIFVHGCFWHGHRRCKMGRLPKSRLEYWGPKIAANAARDTRKVRALRRGGWSVLTIWECATKDEGRLEKTIRAALRRHEGAVAP
jgi:DNA mismatch endonuclease (patch repair protein)